ncbi:MAG: hypothetical protein LBS54_07200 [Dysgonamonadaceae bacterium]|jgi:hypothetical protein|nr:hypothetical protein [Dysgonamonadaceae bacterium]
MKKLFLAIIAMGFTLTASAQFKGRIEVYKLDGLTIHSYKSAEAMADLTFIIEGKDGLVILEQQSFLESIKDFNNYLATLNKPVVKVIANYHTGGLADWDASKVVMVEGMPEFEKGAVYSGMFGFFSQIFDGAMDLRPHGEVATVAFNSTHNWAGIDFKFLHGAKSDFPAASINIANKVYYMHFAPVFAHMTGDQINSAAAIDATIEELSNAKASGCVLFIGSHGKPGRIDAVNFQLQYLGKMKEIFNSTRRKDEFVKKMTESFIGILGIDGLNAVADKLYQ